MIGFLNRREKKKIGYRFDDLMVAAFVCLYVRPAHSAFLENPPEDF
jgi:hypothetical protein